MLVDLHTHLAPGSLDHAALLARADALGLAGVALLGDAALPDLKPLPRSKKLVLFAGAEVETDRGHYLVFFPDPAALPSLDEMFGARENGVWPVRDVVARVQVLGGAIVAAHPYDPTVPHPGGDILYTLPSIQAVESVNPKHRAASASAAIEAAETLGLPCTGGSDARSLEALGSAATLFTRALKNEAELVEALRSGACWPVEFGDPPAYVLKRGAESPREPRESREPREPRESRPEGSPNRRRRRRR